MLKLILRSTLSVSSLVGAWFLAPLASAQESTQPDFGALTAPELVAEMDRIETAGAITPDVVQAAASRAIAILCDENEIGAVDPGLLVRIVRIAEPGLKRLSSEEQQRLLAAIAQLSSAPELIALAATYEWLHFRVGANRATKGAPSDSQQLVEDWINQSGLGQLTAEQINWCLMQLLPQQVDRLAFSATWTGQVTAPQTGQYVFSVSPMNVNNEKIGGPVRHSIDVYIDDQKVIGASFDNWQWEGAPIELESTRPASIRVEMTYKSREAVYRASPHCILYWKGPGMSRRVVPSQSLSKPDGGAGLLSEYQWTAGDLPQQVAQETSSIQYAWATCRDVPLGNPQLVSDLTERLFQFATDPSYIAQLLAPPAQGEPSRGHPYFRNYTSTEFLTIDQRQQFLETLLQTPDLLRQASDTQILRLYQSLRPGDEDAALTMLGTWMQFRPDAAPRIAKHFLNQNRRFYRKAGAYLAFHTSDSQRQQFQDDFLHTSDDRCCLPVAYSLAYSHLLNETLDQWVDLLNEKLQDQAIDGEGRVNWLLARAHAQEIAGSVYAWDDENSEALLKGHKWLVDAREAATHDATRTRIYREEIARMVGGNHKTLAESVLNDASGTVPEEQLDAWRAKSDAVFQSWIDRQAADDAASNETYLAYISKLRDAAVAQGDEDDASRYESLLRDIQSD